VLARVNAARSKVVVEKVFSVTAIGNTIVDQELQDNLNGSLAVERQVLSVTGNNFAVTLKTLFHSRAVTTLMLHESFRADVDDVVTGGLAQLTIPLEDSNGFSTVEILYGFVDSCGALFCAQGCLAWLAQRVTVEASEHLLQVRDEGARVCAQSILKLKNLLV
jgi:hypothetical protein